MRYRNLGRTDLEVSPLCLGTMQFGWTADEATSFEVLSAAYEAGVNFIDTADVYSRWVEGNPGGVAETIIGKWAKKANVPRDKIIIATKLRAPMSNDPTDQGLSRTHIMKSVDNSLRRLDMEYIDLYQTHYPDEDTPIEETLRAMDDLIQQGKVRHIGCSNYPAWQLMESLWTSDKHDLVRFESIQPHHNLVHRAEFERELKRVCTQYELGVIPYSPLAAGFLSGKYRKDSSTPDTLRSPGVIRRHFKARNWAFLEKMDEVKGKYPDHSHAQIALAWLLGDPVITSPIIGPKNLSQLADNLGAIELQLSSEDKASLDEASQWEN